MSDVTLSGEYGLAVAALRLSDSEVARLARNGFRSAFLPRPEREALLAQFEAEFGPA